MSERTIQTCPECKHEGEMPSRRVVICDQCGATADMIHCPYTNSLSSPSSWSGGTWTGGFYKHDRPVREGYAQIDSADFCSQACRGEYEKTHERAVVIA
jgi:hypothetical protein